VIPRKFIKRRASSPAATCEQWLAPGFRCRAAMQYEIKKPKVWSYQERIIERCTMGHITHAQAVVDEPPQTLNYSQDEDAWGV
jgi:hypothetical protein